jgi:putative flippase GtrA
MTFADLRVAERVIHRVPRVLTDLFVYGMVSVMALSCDAGMLFLLVSRGVHYFAASLLSFSVGVVVSYLLSIRFVFADRRAASRDAEIVGFVAVGIAGLLLTQAFLFLFVTGLSMHVAMAKAVTVGIVFGFNFLARRHVVFAHA